LPRRGPAPAGEVYGLVAAIQWIIDLLRNPGEIIVWGGYPALAAVVFLETGAMIFFLPGDSLLVMAGLYAAKGDLDIWVLNGLLVPLAIAGDATSYWIGTRTGPHLFNRPRSRFFRPEHVRAAHEFYERHGGKAIIIARFMPLVRTFVPVVAGIGGMSYRRFASYNVVGAVGWVTSMTLIGFVLGSRFPLLVQHIEKVIVVVVLLSILPGGIEWLRSRRRAVVKAASRSDGA
jgi:membrane-associated protein